MSERTRFCVLFGSSEDGQPAKTRLMHSDSSREDLIEIWKQMYNEDDVPVDAELVNEDCVYRLDDDNDIAAFLAQAEDQYRLLPSQPLRVMFVASHRYCKNTDTLAIVNNDTVSPSKKTPATVPERMEMVKQEHIDAPKDLTTGVRIDVNSNNNNGHHNNHQGAKPFSDSRQSQSFVSGSKEFAEDSNQEQQPSSWSPANSLLMLYNRYRGQEKMNQRPTFTETDSRTVGGVIDKITTASASNKFPCADGVNRYNVCDSTEYPYGNPYATYSKHLADSLGRPPVSFATDLNKDNGAENSLSGIPANMPNQAFNLSAYSAFINGLQERKQMAQGNPNASYILQTLFNNHIKGNLSIHGQQHHAGYSNINGNSPSRNQLATPSNLIASPEYSASTSGYQTGRPPSILSTLAQYNNSSLFNYINGAAMTSLQTGVNSEYGAVDFSKKTPKRRKRNGRLVDDDKSSDPSKRMRSSISQSNIEYHYQRAIDYSQMAEEDQKRQNSAHRSHWKHLLFVAKISPKFLEIFKHAKYDEWSSEARDIFAISQPDKYMWSFLTLSKQGDMLCKRLTARVDGLMRKSAEDRPDWCPDNETLLRAQTRARERLDQLQRILYSRSVNQEAKAVEKANEMEKLSMQGKNLALMTAYRQGQQELLRNQQQSFIKDAGNFRQQENSRPSATFPANQTTTHCSSVTSSPLSVASPAFEENIGAGSGCSESPVLSHGGPVLSHGDQRIEMNLVIVEERELSPSPEPVRNVSVNNIPSLPYAATNVADA